MQTANDGEQRNTCREGGEEEEEERRTGGERRKGAREQMRAEARRILQPVGRFDEA